ncbi:hypothetical protein [Geodermatophilus obscurus]|uniref:hypothetical protein n=1 Tax=Geodermatophilus obscurus TaxID=1861 RepID=UPI000932D3C7|nr:hypothetical protein [Geodermatophilus obscurus]
MHDELGDVASQLQGRRPGGVAAQDARSEVGEQGSVGDPAVRLDPGRRRDVGADRHTGLPLERRSPDQRRRVAEQVVAVDVQDGRAGHPLRPDVVGRVRRGWDDVVSSKSRAVEDLWTSH